MWRSRLLFLTSLGAAGALIRFYDDKRVGYTLLYALILLLLFSLVTMLGAPRLIRVKEGLDKTSAVKNESLTYRAQVDNRGLFFYPRLETVYHNPELFRYGEGGMELSTLPPRGGLKREYSIRFPYRGVYSLGINSVVVTDLLGLFRRSIPVRSPLSVVVYPESDEAFAWSVRNEPQNSSLNTDLWSEDYSAVADVRKYTSSDSLRKVHWKLSAKRGELIVKNFHSFEPGRTILFLDNRAIPLEGSARAAFEDKMVSYVAAAVDHCMRGRLTADLIFGEGDDDHMIVDESEDLGEVYTRLAEIRLEGQRSALFSAREITGSYSMVIFLAGMDEAVADAIKDLVSFDHNIVLYSFHSAELPLTEPGEEQLESLKAYGVGVNRVEIGGDAG